MTSRGEVTGETDAFPTWRVGIHTSIAGSFDQAAEKAHNLTCTAFQIFSSSPRMWNAREPRSEELAAMSRLRLLYDLHPLVIHANYLINLASANPALRKQSLEAFRGEIGRAAALGAEFLVLHPGSFRDTSVESGIRNIAASMREAIGDTPLRGVSVLIENTAGQGSCIGKTFEELQDILALLDGLPIGCCIDTAHCFAAGMDISTSEGLEKIINSLERTVGLDKVKIIHTNDSRSAMGSRLDRHEHIGKGGIGMEGFGRIVNHPALRDKTFILETPFDAPEDGIRNMKAIRSLRLEDKRKLKIRHATDEKQNNEEKQTRHRAPQAAVPGIQLSDHSTDRNGPAANSRQAVSRITRTTGSGVRQSGKANR